VIESSKTQTVRANHLWVSAAMLVAVVVILVSAKRPAEAAFPGTSGAIAFTGLHCIPNSGGGSDCTTQVYRMNADGFGPDLLTPNTPAANYAPTWSADGEKIAFTNDPSFDPGDTNNDVYVMNADGTNQPINLTNNTSTSYDGSPAWFPGGHNTIAFQSNRSGDWDLYKLSFDVFGNTTMLTPLTTNPQNDFGPAVSPDGKKIAFASNRDGDAEIYVMKAAPESATNKPIKLTKNSFSDGSPDWSPNGRRIVFESNRDSDQEIFIMNADGTLQKNLTKNTDYDTSPVFSPDGKKIAFVSNRNVDQDIWRMRVDGTNPVNITDDNGTSFSNALPDWQPLP
jgi:Tol biopolymer transport system component